MLHIVLQFVTACSRSLCLEADSFTTNKIHCILRNPTFQYHVHTRPPPIPALSQINPVNYRFRTEFKMIAPSMPMSIKWLLCCGFPTHTSSYFDNLICRWLCYQYTKLHFASHWTLLLFELLVKQTASVTPKPTLMPDSFFL
jgi:hypothetical protein